MLRKLLRYRAPINQNMKYIRFLSIVPFKLADIGEGIAEVELLKWFVQVNIYFIRNGSKNDSLNYFVRKEMR
jgi:hypothetical protein